MSTYTRALTVDQRAFIVGEEGICPGCGNEVEWKDVDPTFYVCEYCMANVVNNPEPSAEETSAHIAGYMDGMADVLKSVLKEMVEKGDPSLSVIREVIKQVETDCEVKL